MFVTATHGLNMFGKHLAPLQPNYLGGIELLNIRKNPSWAYLEVTDKPRIFKKRYYAGCDVKDKTIILKRIGGIGDVIFTLPVARKLAHMGAKVIYCTSPKDHDLFKNVSFIDSHTEREHIRMEELKGIDWVLDYFSSIENGYRPGDYTDAYDTCWQWAFGEDFGGDVSGCLSLDTDEKIWAKSILKKPTIALGMRSSSPKRAWYHWDILIKKILKKYDHDILILGDSPINSDDKRIINLAGKTTVRQFLSLIWACECVITPDSGNLHVAGQFNKPTVALFSTVDYKTRTKYYPKCESIQAKTECSPCVKLHEYCSKEAECMSSITPYMVMKALEKVI